MAGIVGCRPSAIGDMAMLTVLRKRQDYQQAERYQVQSLQKIMQDKGIETTEQENSVSLRNYIYIYSTFPA